MNGGARSMSTAPTRSNLPHGLTLEKPGRNLAALATTEALLEVQRAVLAQWRHHETFAKLAKHGIRPVDRLLFHGPPGNGKTMASQWLAQQIDAPLFRVQCEQLVQMYMGQTTGNMARIMEWLQSQPRCVALFDEVECVFPSRERSKGASGAEMNNAMSVFWQYLDRWESPTLFVMCTNMPDRLDPALLSRIDLKMEFGPPTPEQASGVAQYWAEVLHEFGGGVWGPLLDDGRQWESFRALFQAVQWYVRMHVANGAAEG
jgi:SpoVK/Ycf46/Vps4 family AAA+-type ATPase